MLKSSNTCLIADNGDCHDGVLAASEKLVQSSGPDFADADSKLFGSIVLARPLPEDATVATLKDLFPGAMEIAFPRSTLGARYVTSLFIVSTVVVSTLPSSRQYQSSNDNREDCQICSVLYCVPLVSE